MSILSKLFGRGNAAPEETPPVEYKDHRIYVAPMVEGKTWRIAARIEKDVDGETKVHQLIRADTLNDLKDAEEASLEKAKQMIDQQARWLFD